MIISIQMENEEHTDTEKLVGELKREQEDILNGTKPVKNMSGSLNVGTRKTTLICTC